MKRIILIIALVLPFVASAQVQTNMVNNTNLTAYVTNTIAAQTPAIIAYLTQAGVGRYPTLKRSSETLVDGYMCSWELESEISVRGIGCCWIFYARKDGKTFRLRDGHGPDYKEGVDSWWEEI